MPSTDESTLVDALEQSLLYLRSSLDGIPASVSTLRTTPERWSVVENLEHIAIVDKRFRGRIAASVPGSEKIENAAREAMIMDRIPARGTRVLAPDFAWPQGRFSSVAEGLAAVVEGVESDVSLVGERWAELRFMPVQHPVLGTISGFEAILLMSAHIRRHANQIAEVREEFKANGDSGTTALA